MNKNLFLVSVLLFGIVSTVFSADTALINKTESNIAVTIAYQYPDNCSLHGNVYDVYELYQFTRFTNKKYNPFLTLIKRTVNISNFVGSELFYQQYI